MATAYIKVAKAVASARLAGVIDKGYLAMFGRGNKLFEDGYGDIEEILRMLQYVEGASPELRIHIRCYDRLQEYLDCV
jgi:hypothetical protein